MEKKFRVSSSVASLFRITEPSRFMKKPVGLSPLRMITSPGSNVWIRRSLAHWARTTALSAMSRRVRIGGWYLWICHRLLISCESILGSSGAIGAALLGGASGVWAPDGPGSGFGGVWVCRSGMERSRRRRLDG